MVYGKADILKFTDRQIGTACVQVPLFQVFQRHLNLVDRQLDPAVVASENQIGDADRSNKADEADQH